MHLNTVRACVRRYSGSGVGSLLCDKTRKPGKKPISQAVKDRLCKLVCNEKPKSETPWSCRSLAKKAGVGHTSVNAILREHKLRPYIARGRNYTASRPSSRTWLAST